MDISFNYTSPVIFSEKAISILKPILERTGQILPIITPSKRKQFFGFVPSRALFSNNIINMVKSNWTKCELDILIREIILNQNAPTDQFLFSFQDNPMIVVDENFKQIVEDNDLKGFDFNSPVQAIPEKHLERNEVIIQKNSERFKLKMEYIKKYGEDAYFINHIPYKKLNKRLKEQFDEQHRQIK